MNTQRKCPDPTVNRGWGDEFRSEEEKSEKEAHIICGRDTEKSLPEIARGVWPGLTLEIGAKPMLSEKETT